MKKIPLIIIMLFAFIGLQAQSVQHFQSHYSGQTDFNSSTGVLTISTNGYLNFPMSFNYPFRHYFSDAPQGVNRKQYEYYIWAVPNNVREIVIKRNTIVNAAFHFEHDMTIRGEDRATSIIYGTDVKDWNGCAHNSVNIPLDGYWMSLVNKVAGKASDRSEVKNLTFLNPKVYDVSGESPYNHGILDVIDCNFIDKRGGATNNSDGVGVSSGSTIENCYFETGDDNIKVVNTRNLGNHSMTVRGCTFNMILNSCPFNIGYGSYSDGAFLDATNIKVIGNIGRDWFDSPLIQGGEWNSSGNNSCTKIDINGISWNNSSASLVSILDPRQYLDGNITNADLNINSYYYCGNGNVADYTNSILKVCGNTFCGSNWACDNNGTAPCTSGNCMGVGACYTSPSMGSTVSSYTVPVFAQNFICSNEGSNAYGSVADVTSNLPDAVYINCCHSICGQNCENCGISNADYCGCQTDPYIRGEWYLSAQFGLIYVSNSQNWYYIADKEIWIYVNPSQDFCSENIWFYSPSSICGYTGWFRTAGSDWVYSSSGTQWLAWNDCFTGSKLDNGTDKNYLIDKISISPNPSGGITRVNYFLSESSAVNIGVYDAMGRQVTTLEETHQLAGPYEQTFDASNLPNGVYYIKIQAGEFSTSKKMIVAR